MEIKSFLKKVFNLIASLFLAAVDMIIYIFAVIALYQDDYLIALLLMLFGIAMEIRKGFRKSAETNIADIAKAIIDIVYKGEMRIAKKKERENG